MELLLSAGVTVVTELVKLAYKKFGAGEATRSVIYILSFMLSLVIGGLYYLYGNKLSPEVLATIATVWGGSIGMHQVVVKNLLNPALDKLNSKQ